MSRAVKLLVSVRNATEAADALAGGADWIDLKEPRRGPLGAVDPVVAREVVALVGAQAPLSAAAGELVDLAPSDQHARTSLQGLLATPGISHVKLGLSNCAGIDWRPRWDAAHDEVVAAGKALVAVIYADASDAKSPPAEKILDEAIRCNCSWALWDTFEKSGESLVEALGIATLSQQLRRARSAGLRTVVAGRLDESRISLLPLELIDMVAVRGAVCVGSRNTAVCPRRTRALRDMLSRHTDCSAVASC